MGSQLSGSPRNSTKPPICLGSDFVRENPTIFFQKNDIFMTIFHDIPLFEDVFFNPKQNICQKRQSFKKKQNTSGLQDFFHPEDPGPEPAWAWLKMVYLGCHRCNVIYIRLMDDIPGSFWMRGFTTAIELECMFGVFLMFRCFRGTNASGKNISSHPCKVLFSHRRGCEWCTCGGLENC